MKKRLFLLTLIIAFTPILSTAEDSVEVETSVNVRANSGNVRVESQVKAREELEARKKELEEKREEIKKEMEEKREVLKAEMETRREEAKGQTEEKREGIKQEMEERRDSIKDKVEDRRDNAVQNIRERLDKFIENIVNRFDAAIERLETLADRIDSRIAKMKAENIDTEEAEDLMITARINIETARTSLLGINLESQTVASSTATTTAEIKLDFEKLRTQIEKAKSDIKKAHASLVDVIRSLKPGQNSGGSINATTTATTTLSN